MNPATALPPRPARLRPQPAARALARPARASPCSSCSTTKKAARTTCCTATRRRETFLSELVTAQAYENRHMTMESMYEYGSRVGVWRILREFEQRGLPLTVFGVVSALERYPELVEAFMARGHEIANHGLRWIHYQNLPEATERRHIGVGHAPAEGADRRRLAAGLVHRPRQPQHAPPGGRPGRLRIRQRLLRRRPAVLAAGEEEPTAAWRRTWWCPTRWTPTTCASCRRRASTPATTSSHYLRDASTRCMPKATRRRTGRR